MTTTLLTTVHGSRLYGLEHEGSDYDTYSVVLGAKTRQKVNGLDDTTVLSLADFLHQVEKGVPQALEALWSPVKNLEVSYAPFFKSLHPDYHQTRATYRRTINNFLLKDTEKTRRHAIRLAINLADFGDFGRFFPRLNAFNAEEVKKRAVDSQTAMNFVEWLGYNEQQKNRRL